MASELGHTQLPVLADGSEAGWSSLIHLLPRPQAFQEGLTPLPQSIHLESTGLPCKAEALTNAKNAGQMGGFLQTGVIGGMVRCGYTLTSRILG